MEFKGKLWNFAQGNDSEPQHKFFLKVNALTNDLINSIEEMKVCFDL